MKCLCNNVHELQGLETAFVNILLLLIMSMGQMKQHMLKGQGDRQ
jgi:hypothetical protein